MPIFAPGVASGILQAQDAMRQQAEQAQLMAQRKQQAQYQAWQEEQARTQAAAQLQARQGMGQALSGMYPPPPVQQAAPQPGQNSAQPPSPPSQAPTASPGGPTPGMGGVPPYRTVANTQAPPQGQPQGQSPQGGPPPVQPQQPQGGLLERFIGAMRKAGVPPEQWADQLDAVAPAIKMQLNDEIAQVKTQNSQFSQDIKRLQEDLKERQLTALTDYRATTTKQADTRLEQGQERIDKKGGAGGGAGGGGGMGGPMGDGKSDADKKLMEFYALSQLSGDSSWKTGMSRGKEGARIIAMVERYVPQLAEKLGVSPTDVIANKGGIQSNIKALMDATKREAGIELGMNALDGHIKNLDKLLDKTAAKGGAIIINKPINAIRRASSDPDIAQLDLAAQQVATEYERVLQGGSLSIAQLHQGAADDAKKLLNGDMTPEQIRAIIPVMRQEMEMSKAGAKKTAEDLRNRIRQPLAGQGGASSAGWKVERVD